METKANSGAKRRITPTQQVLKRLFKNKGAVVGLVIIVIMIILAVISPWIMPYDYAQIDILAKCQTPSAQHLLGTDHLGRDILSRILYGGRASLQIGIFSALGAMALATIIGSISGFFGGKVDNIMMRVLDIIQAMPGMLLSVVICAVLGNGLFETTVALMIGNMTSSARIMRGTVLTVRKSEYIDAAVVDNTGKLGIIWKHIVPNAFSPMIVQATMGCAHAILTAASLSFIGLGVQPPTPEWGAMLSEGRNYIRDFPHIITIPGIAIMLTVLALNLFGDGLRDALDPKQKR